jgi:2-haloacid dehalogenase
MGLDPTAIETVTFDSFSTLVDLDSTAPAVETLVEDPTSFAHDWHDRAVHYSMIANYIDAYETYYQLHRDALEYLLAARDVDVSADELDEMVSIYHEMEPFDDVRPGMKQLHEAEYDLGIISNGDPPMLDSLVRVADIDEFVTATVSADEIERHKPARELYEHAADRLEVAPESVVHVTNGRFDAQGAMHAGMQGVWLDRDGSPSDPFGPDPDLTVRSMDDFVQRL